MPIIYKGWAKPDDPIYKMGLVVSAQNIKCSHVDIASEPEATSKDNAEPHSNPVGNQSRGQRPSRVTKLKYGCEYGEHAVKALCPAHMAEWNETHGRWTEQYRRPTVPEADAKHDVGHQSERKP